MGPPQRGRASPSSLFLAVFAAAGLLFVILLFGHHTLESDARALRVGSGARLPSSEAEGARGEQQHQAQQGSGVGSAAGATGSSGRCGEALADTELGGDVVRWGADHKMASAAACCAACAAAPGCNVWVWCHASDRCHSECWLKALQDPWEDADTLRGTSARWTSGVMGPRPPPAGSGGGAAAQSSAPPAPPDFAVVTDSGEFRVRLFADAAPLAAEFIRRVAGVAPGCSGCRWYRAEPVPVNWGSLDAPDSWNGGRWGPPYALLQGSFMPARTDDPGGAPLPGAPPAETGKRARPLIRRGMIAWAGGGGGPDGFIALADHPEWGHGHTVWGEVVSTDMSVVDRIMQERPIRVENWGSINASVFATPLPFRLRWLRPPAAAAAGAGGGVAGG